MNRINKAIDKYMSLESIFHPELLRSTTSEKVVCGTLGDLEQLGVNKFSILNALDPSQVVRKIKITENEVLIDVMDNKGYQRFPKDTKVYFESWFMDRGSYLIYVDNLQSYGKLATQYDKVVF